MSKNIVYIHSHDTGRYISPYGHAIPTPNLLAFAEQSVLFRQAYTTAPTCSPSRAGLLTGTYPHTNGMLGLAHRGFGLNDYSKHLSNYLSSHGYETALSGVQHEVDGGRLELLGYDHTFKAKGKTADQENAAHAAEFIKGKHDKPFFLSFGMFHTHKEYPVDHEGFVPAI
jgi:N-sulfoglucosamine sulfohydrolase